MDYIWVVLAATAAACLHLGIRGMVNNRVCDWYYTEQIDTKLNKYPRSLTKCGKLIDIKYAYNTNGQIKYCPFCGKRIFKHFNFIEGMVYYES